MPRWTGWPALTALLFRLAAATCDYLPTGLDYGAPLVLTACNTSSSAQAWTFAVGSLALTLSGFAEDVCADVCGGQFESGAAVGSWECVYYSPNQQWYVRVVGRRSRSRTPSPRRHRTLHAGTSSPPTG